MQLLKTTNHSRKHGQADLGGRTVMEVSMVICSA